MSALPCQAGPTATSCCCLAQVPACRLLLCSTQLFPTAGLAEAVAALSAVLAEAEQSKQALSSELPAQLVRLYCSALRPSFDPSQWDFLADAHLGRALSSYLQGLVACVSYCSTKEHVQSMRDAISMVAIGADKALTNANAGMSQHS